MGDHLDHPSSLRASYHLAFRLEVEVVGDPKVPWAYRMEEAEGHLVHLSSQKEDHLQASSREEDLQHLYSPLQLAQHHSEQDRINHSKPVHRFGSSIG